GGGAPGRLRVRSEGPRALAGTGFGHAEEGVEDHRAVAADRARCEGPETALQFRLAQHDPARVVGRSVAAQVLQRITLVDEGPAREQDGRAGNLRAAVEQSVAGVAEVGLGVEAVV